MDWKGEINLDGNTIGEALLHGNFNPQNGIRSREHNRLRFDFISTGNSLNLCLQVGEPGRGRLRFESTAARFEIDLAKVEIQPKRMFEAPIDQFLEISLCPYAELPMSMSFSFTAPPPSLPETPYFIRVRQIDEAKAWTSPFYVSS